MILLTLTNSPAFWNNWSDGISRSPFCDLCYQSFTDCAYSPVVLFVSIGKCSISYIFTCHYILYLFVIQILPQISLENCALLPQSSHLNGSMLRGFFAWGVDFVVSEGDDLVMSSKLNAWSLLDKLLESNRVVCHVWDIFSYRFILL